jgi:3-methyladenine DNA glycosylase AlkD
MKTSFYNQILHAIKKNSGKPTQHTFLATYLGNTHPRYPISAPVVRTIAKTWMQEHKDITAIEFATLLTALIEGESFTEKVMAGILLDYATAEQRKFQPEIFDQWLDHLEGWAEVDVLCTGKYSHTEIESQWSHWKPLLVKFSRSKNIHKRRASLVFFCAPLRKTASDALSKTALQLVDRLKGEKEILITKAISWLLRSMVKYNRTLLEIYMKENAETLPAIARRETLVKLTTGKKTTKKKN